jgi:predicted deacetylase
MSAYLFIRNDDVWKLDRPFRYFFDMAMDRGLPVVYAVIPGKMEPRLVRFLRRAREKRPRLLDIVQHGWTHTDHSAAADTKYEFGRSRSLGLQRFDIQKGLEKMRLAFGEHLLPAFVPPYHGYDARTLQVLHEEGFRIFSAGAPRRTGVKKRFLEIPAQVSFSRYEQGRTNLRNAGELTGCLVRAAGSRPLSGVVMHHADVATAAARRELARFFDLVVSLRDKKGWRVLLFSDLLRA